jgi:diacylglycerol kinase (ATP)
MAVPKAEYLLIVNPVAGRGRAQALLPALQHMLHEKRLSYELRLTSRPGEATTLAAEGIRAGFVRVVAVGGDGTVHEVATALVGTQAALGVIPAGSGNDFCKAVEIPLNLSRAVAVLVHDQRRCTDVGRLGPRYFVNGLGMGLDGAVSHRYRQQHRLRGELGYLWAAIHEALTFQAIPMELTMPGWSYWGPALLLGASNGPYHGGNFKLAPDARVDDGLFDVYIIQDMHPLRRLLQIPKVRRGTHLSLKEVQIRRAPWVEIASCQAIPAHMDGEPFELPAGQHLIEILPHSLEVIS